MKNLVFVLLIPAWTISACSTVNKGSTTASPRAPAASTMVDELPGETVIFSLREIYGNHLRASNIFYRPGSGANLHTGEIDNLDLARNGAKLNCPTESSKPLMFTFKNSDGAEISIQVNFQSKPVARDTDSWSNFSISTTSHQNTKSQKFAFNSLSRKIEIDGAWQDVGDVSTINHFFVETNYNLVLRLLSDCGLAHWWN
jgi:hypothetical protein